MILKLVKCFLAYNYWYRHFIYKVREFALKVLENPILIGKKEWPKKKRKQFLKKKSNSTVTLLIFRPTPSEVYDLAKQEQFYRDNVVSRLKSKDDLKTEPIPDYITLDGKM